MIDRIEKIVVSALA